MTPESFVERFESLPSILGTLIEFRNPSTFQREMDLSRALMSEQYVPSTELLQFMLSWHELVAGIADRKAYAQYISEFPENGSLYPVVDKKLDVVISLHREIGHQGLIEWLFLGHKKWSDEATSVRDVPAEYVLEGIGYFRSSRYPRFIVGKTLFEKNLLDIADEIITQGRIDVVSDHNDFMNIKAHF